MRVRNAVMVLCLTALGCEAPAIASKADPALVARLAITAGLVTSDAAAEVPKQKVGDKCFYCNGVGKVSDGVVAPKMCIPCKGTGKVQPPDDDDNSNETGNVGPTDQPELTQEDLTGPVDELADENETTEEICVDGSCAQSQSNGYQRTYRRRLLFRRW